MDLERQRNILIIGHQAILRCIYAYFMNHSHEKLPYIKIPLHTLIQLTPKAYTCEEKRYKVDIEAVDTHRPKPRAGAPKTDAGQPMDHIPTEAEAKSGKDAAITTTTMSTTTFRDSPYSTRHNSFTTARSDKNKEKEPAASGSGALEDTARVIRAALVDGVTSDAVPTPAATLSPSKFKTPSADSKPDESGPSVPIASTPPLSPVPSQVPSATSVDHDMTPLSDLKETRGYDSEGTSQVSSLASGSNNISTPAAASNLTIKTDKHVPQSLVTTPPTRFKGDASLHPTPAWVEGPEYERTAGASPRDPVISPGGRLLPKKKENWHFPVSSLFLFCFLQAFSKATTHSSNNLIRLSLFACSDWTFSQFD